MHYSDDLIILEVTFIEGRVRRTRLALLKDINTRVAGEAEISPDDLMITLYEAPGVNFSFGQGEAQRVKGRVRSNRAPSEEQRPEGGGLRHIRRPSRRVPEAAAHVLGRADVNVNVLTLISPRLHQLGNRASSPQTLSDPSIPAKSGGRNFSRRSVSRPMRWLRPEELPSNNSFP